MAELEYLRSHAVAVQQNPDLLESAPTKLIIQTDLLSDLIAFTSVRSVDASPACQHLRRRLQQSPITSVSILHYSEGHFTAFNHHIGSNIFEFGDSLHHPPDPSLGPLIRQALSTSDLQFPSRVEIGTINQQGGHNGGEASCGLAAFNFIQRYLDPKRELWSGRKAQQFRDEALGDVIHFCVLSQSCIGSPENWLEPATGGLHTMLDAEAGQWATAYQKPEAHVNFIGSGYNDYNLYKPLVCLSAFPQTLRHIVTHHIGKPSYLSIP